MEDSGQFMSAKEAAAELNVSVATLYAYVSRGVLQSEAKQGTRARRYKASEVRALADRTKIAKSADNDSVLSFGAPLLDSAITYTDGKTLLFRGRDSSSLAVHARLEAVASLIWDCKDDVFGEESPFVPDNFREIVASTKRPLVACQSLFPLLGEMDPRAFDRSKQGSCRTGARVVRLMTALLGNSTSSDRPVHEQLSEAWGIQDHSELLRSALVLAADHELNASTFTVRVAASAGAPLYHVVAAGLAALQAPRHGGEIERAYRLIREIAAEDDMEDAIVSVMRRGDPIPGFGHPFYQDGDPRARTLRCLLAKSGGASSAENIDHCVRLFELVTGQHLNFDGSLALLALHLRLPSYLGLSTLAAGRVVGWIGHAIEQYQDHRLIRPRARYVGLR